MRDRLDELGTDTVVVLVTFTESTNLDGYVQRVDVPFPVLTDPTREAYRAYGFGRGSRRRIWGPKVLRRYYDILRSDGLGNLRRPTEDTLQLGGDIIIDPDGTLAWGFWGDGPDDRPSVDQLIDAVNAINPKR